MYIGSPSLGQWCQARGSDQPYSPGVVFLSGVFESYITPGKCRNCQQHCTRRKLCGIVSVIIFSCRRMDKKRRQKLVESLRSGGDSESESSAAVAPDRCEPDGGEPEDIKELFYFYWRQGTSIAASRQAFSVELNSRVDEQVEAERNGPRRQTVSAGDHVSRKIQGKGASEFNRAPLVDRIRQQRRCSASDTSRVGTPGSRCPTERYRGHRQMQFRRGISDLGPATESEEFKTETNSVFRDENSTKHELHRTNPAEEDDNNVSEVADRKGTDVSSIEHKAAADESDEKKAMSLASVLGSEGSGELDLTRYLISANEERPRSTLRRLNSCPESEMNSTIGERTWSFSSLLWTWDFKKSSVVHDIDFPDV